MRVRVRVRVRVTYLGHTGQLHTRARAPVAARQHDGPGRQRPGLDARGNFLGREVQEALRVLGGRG